MTMEAAVQVERRLAPRWGAVAGVLLAGMCGMLLLNLTAWIGSFSWGWPWGLVWVRLVDAAAVAVLAGGCVALVPRWARAVAQGTLPGVTLGLIAAIAYLPVAGVVWLLATAQLIRSAAAEGVVLALTAAMAAVLAAVTGWWMILVMMERGHELALAESQAGALRLADCVAWSCGWYAVGMAGTLLVLGAIGSQTQWQTGPAWYREMVGAVENGWPGMAGPLLAGMVALAAFGLTRRRGGWRRVARATGWLSAVVWATVMGAAVGMWVWQMWTL